MNDILSVFNSLWWAISEIIITFFIIICGLVFLHKKKVYWYLYLAYGYFAVICIIINRPGTILFWTSFFFIILAKHLGRLGFKKEFPLTSIILPPIVIPTLFIIIPMLTTALDLWYYDIIYLNTVVAWNSTSPVLGIFANLWLVNIPTKKTWLLIALGCIAPIVINLIFLVLLLCVD